MLHDKTDTPTAGAVVPFEFEGTNVRVIERDGEPWFVAKDVAKVLGYAHPTKDVRNHCKAAQAVGGGTVSVTPLGLDPQTVIIPERDVYRLIMRSKLPAAERFEEWVVGEVLPAIRRTGVYAAPGADQAMGGEALTDLAMRFSTLENLVGSLLRRMEVGRIENEEPVRITAGEFLVRKGIERRPRGSARWLSSRLTRLHELHGVQVSRGRLGSTEARLFDLDFTERCWAEGLREAYLRHAAEKEGRPVQGVLHLVTSAGAPAGESAPEPS